MGKLFPPKLAQWTIEKSLRSYKRKTPKIRLSVKKAGPQSPGLSFDQIGDARQNRPHARSEYRRAERRIPQLFFAEFAHLREP